MLLQAVLLLPLAAALMRVFGFGRLIGWLGRGRGSMERRARADHAQAAAAGRLVHIAASHGLYRHTTCLTRSLVLWWLLRHAGIAADLQIGVRRETGHLSAHAWVECCSVPVNDAPDVATRFTPFSEPAGPGLLSFD